MTVKERQISGPMGLIGRTNKKEARLFMKINHPYNDENGTSTDKEELPKLHKRKKITDRTLNLSLK